MSGFGLDGSTAAAFLSAVAAAAAAFAAWKAPLSAAKMSEKMRRQGDKDIDIQRFQLDVFTRIMQGRAEIYSADTVRALNSIDIAFINVAKVRDAWAELYQSLEEHPLDNSKVNDRLRKLLREMALEIGVSDSLRADDFARVYYPNALMEETHLRVLQTRGNLSRFGTGQNLEKNGSRDFDEKWPPSPN